MFGRQEEFQTNTGKCEPYISGTGYDFTGRAFCEDCDLLLTSPICPPPSRRIDNRYGNSNAQRSPREYINPKTFDNRSATSTFDITQNDVNQNEISARQCDPQGNVRERKPNVWSATKEEDLDSSARYNFFSHNLAMSCSKCENVKTDESFEPGTMNDCDIFLGDYRSDNDSDSSFMGSDSSTVPFPPLILENLKKKLNPDHPLSIDELISLPVVESKLSENPEPENVTVLLSVPRFLNSNVVQHLNPEPNSERGFGPELQNAVRISNSASVPRADDAVETKEEPFWLSEFSGELKSEIEVEDIKIENIEDTPKNESRNNITKDQKLNECTGRWNDECEFEETIRNVNKDKLALLRRYIIEGDECVNVIEEQTCSKKPEKGKKKMKNKEEFTKKKTENFSEDHLSMASNTILRTPLTRCSTKALQIIKNDDSERIVKKPKRDRGNSIIENQSREKENLKSTEKSKNTNEPSEENSGGRQRLEDEGREMREMHFPGFVFKFCQCCGSVSPVDWFYISYVTKEMKCLNCFKSLNWSGIKKIHRELNKGKTTNNDANTENTHFGRAESFVKSDAGEQMSRPVLVPSVPSRRSTIESGEERRDRKRKKSSQKLIDDARKSKNKDKDHKDFWEVVRVLDSSTEEEASCVTKRRLIKKKKEYMESCSEICDKVSELKDKEPGNSKGSNEK